MGDPTQHPTTESHRLLITTRQNDRMSEDLPFGSRGGLAFRYNFPLDGDYKIGVRLQKEFASGRIRGVGREEEIDVRLDGQRVKDFKFGGKFAKSGKHVIGEYGMPGGIADAEQTRYELRGDEDLNVDVKVAAGPHVVAVSLVNFETAEPETPYAGHMPVASIANFSDINAPMDIDSVQIEAMETAKQPSETASRRQVFVCHPSGSAEEASCAEKILSNLTRFAYRRPVTGRDVQPLLAIYGEARKQRDFEGGIEAALERILIAPEFLFRVEQDPPKIAPGSVYHISDLDLASRLSFSCGAAFPMMSF